MERNVGGMDKTIRLVLGVVFALGVFLVSATLAKVLLGAVAVIAFGTALSGFCPLNRLFGVNTSRPGSR